MPTLREAPADAVIISHQLMLRAGLIRKLSSGIYTFLPLGLKVIKKISKIIEEEMILAGAQEILMPMVQPAELWQESGRYFEYGPELLRFKDRKESLFCLGPTHEEVVTSLVRDHIKSYKHLPLTLFQIQTKFRDEIRPRFGLMRGREFLMKDAYSFCADRSTQDQIYQKMWDAYNKIFTRCGLDFRAVRAATGTIGGDLSHEFQVLAKSGEDAIASCDSCKYAANIELAKVKGRNEVGDAKEGDPCGECGAPFTILRGIEVGHIFYLGKKYSKVLNASFQNELGENEFMEMGCYGIGVSRVAAACIEQSHDDKGIIWPKSIAPFDIHLVQLGEDPDINSLSAHVYEVLQKNGYEVLWDERDERAGVKLNDADLLGCPLRITIGKRSAKDGQVELLFRKDQSKGPIILFVNESFIDNILKLFN